MDNLTPGTWEAKRWACHAATTIMSGDIVIAECSGHGRPSVVSIADAKIIAAAKDMYAALKVFIDYLGPDGYYPQIGKSATDKARAALAKAEGKSNG
jgi:hypothetical protein